MELKTARGRLFLFIALLVALPLINYELKIIESGKLDGVAPKPEFAPFSLENWWDGKFQEQRNTYFNDSIGFRPDLVRMNNQLDYWLFRKVNANTIILGNDDYLFGSRYIDEYNGLGYPGDTGIIDACYKMKKIQDTMAKLGKTFVFVTSPSKPYFFSEKIPEYLVRREAHKTTYWAYEHFADSLHVNKIDFNAWFKKIKDTSKHVLMTRQGIHWSIYGGMLAADSMVKYIEHARGINLPHLHLTKFNYSDTPRSPDADLGTILNLIYPITKEHLTYPDLEYMEHGAVQKPKTIYIGDSFLWLWNENHVMQKTSNGWEFWYYNNTVWSDSVAEAHMSDYKWQESMMKADCIVLMYTPFNFNIVGAPDGFVNKAYAYFYPNSKR